MSANPSVETIEIARFSWGGQTRTLFRPQPAPPGWWRAVFLVYLADILVIAACVGIGHFLLNDAFGWFHERRPGTFASVAALAISGVICFRIQRRVTGSSLASFWFAFGLLFCIVAADDLFSLHELADRYLHYALRRDRFDRVTDHLDNVIVAMYALPAIYLAVRHAKLLIEARLTLQVLAVAFVIFAVHLVLDALIIWPVVEEALKLTAGCTILLAFLATLMLPSLPESWTRNRITEIPGSLRTLRRWVRLAGATAFIAVVCAVIAALFTYGAALRNRDPSQQLLLHACTMSLIVAAMMLFYAGHRLSVYATRLQTVQDAAPHAQASAWRAGALSAIAVLGLTVTVTIWACRIHIPQRPERARSRPKPTTARVVAPR